MANKYDKLKKQYSTDGINWYDVSPAVYRTGELIEENSADCDNVQTVYQWVTVVGEHVCDGFNKYYVLKEQVSNDGGLSWTDTGTTKQGELIESASIDCGYGITWELVENKYICEEA